MKRKRKFKRFLLVPIVIIIGMAGLIFMVFQIKLGEIEKEANSISIQDIDITGVADGIYEGQYYMENILGAKIELEVQNHEIQRIDFLDHKYGRGKRAESIVEEVMEKQSLQVDAISGATASSKIILKAIEKALTP